MHCLIAECCHACLLLNNTSPMVCCCWVHLMVSNLFCFMENSSTRFDWCIKVFVG